VWRNAALKSNDHHLIASVLSPEAAQFLLTPTADELKDFTADFRGLYLSVYKDLTTGGGGDGGRGFVGQIASVKTQPAAAL